MRAAGFVLIGFEIGTTFADFALRTGAHFWGPHGELMMLGAAAGIALTLAASRRGQ